MDLAQNSLAAAKDGVNGLFVNKEPWQIASITATTVLTSVWLYNFIFNGECITKRSKKTFYKWLRKVPAVRRKVDKELGKIRSDFVRDVEERFEGLESTVALPARGLEKEELLELVKAHLTLGNYKWREGRVSGAVYCLDNTLMQITTEVYGLASYTNPLHADVFPGVNKMEAEVVRMAANMFNGGSEACGTMTTGGTESILMACKAYRDLAVDKGVRRPEMVVPSTAHSAFDKAAQYLNIRVRTVPVNPRTLNADVAAMRKAINSHTCMIVGSAPNFPYGTMDDIAAIAALGESYGIPVHVDACLGGFLIAFMASAGYPLPLFDFRLKGVTSISADTHKYGFAPKGSSVILYREPVYRHYQYTVTTDWPGGVYGSPTVNGSRAGGVIAACWATMRYFGLDRYVQMTESIIRTSRYIEANLRRIPGVFVFGTPVTSVIALGSKDFDIFLLSEQLHKLGWSLNALQFPSGIHLCVTLLHTRPGVADSFIEDVKREVALIMKDPSKPVEGKMAIYGVAQSIPDRSLVSDITKYFIDSMYYVPESKAIVDNGKSTIL